MEDAKPLWASKTFWTNVVGAVAMGLTAAGYNLEELGLTEGAQAQIIAGVLAVANIALRFVTKQPVKVK